MRRNGNAIDFANTVWYISAKDLRRQRNREGKFKMDLASERSSHRTVCREEYLIDS